MRREPALSAVSDLLERVVAVAVAVTVTITVTVAVAVAVSIAVTVTVTITITVAVARVFTIGWRAGASGGPHRGGEKHRQQS